MKKLILVRHAESQWNTIGRYQGRIDTDLSPAGGEQILRLEKIFSSIPVDIIFSSPLVRAKKTAAAVAKFSHVPVTIDDRLSEIHHGEWQGLYTYNVERTYPEILSLWKTKPWVVQMPGGEHFFDVVRRVQDIYSNIVRRHESIICVVSHDVILRLFLILLLSLPYEDFWRFSLDNASVTEISYNDVPSIISFNKTVHLKGVQSHVSIQAL
ncbi:MAG TPA: histidine phosphatase family protein [Patescibacteria group bacterium]|nr:histidine phosphatase family protein [Patescibacteria group bacterium]